jgi:hypothetical protein
MRQLLAAFVLASPLSGEPITALNNVRLGVW